MTLITSILIFITSAQVNNKILKPLGRKAAALKKITALILGAGVISFIFVIISFLWVTDLPTNVYFNFFLFWATSLVFTLSSLLQILVFGPKRVINSKNSSSGTTDKPISSTGTGNSLESIENSEVMMLHDHRADAEDELEATKGDIIEVLKKENAQWWLGKSKRTGRTGLFPASFVRSDSVISTPPV
eukprot:TRINITY_DN4057_c0_g2_i5.p2 TRINITY_DN4057_c0_g2~~TRINITY_DN4057_c0_g2_i5.p2  ORF type:complete len:188 (+),score=28.51 TRINITY_DN4057_c0_g2_i5:256-819(+)